MAREIMLSVVRSMAEGKASISVGCSDLFDAEKHREALARAGYVVSMREESYQLEDCYRPYRMVRGVFYCVCGQK